MAPIITTPTSDTEYGRALAAIDGLGDLFHRRDRLRKLRIERPRSAAQIEQSAIADLIANAAPGWDFPFPNDEIPLQLGRDILAAVGGESAAEQTKLIRKRAIEQVEDQIEMAIMDGADPALSVLAASLDDLLRRARAAVAQAGPVASAEDAVRGSAKQLDGWRTLNALADRYSEIRQAQASICRYVLSDEERGTTLRDFGELRAKWELYQPGEASAPPWPHHKGDPDVPLSEPALIRWFVRDERAQPWVPTLAELAEAPDRRRAWRDARPMTPSGLYDDTADAVDGFATVGGGR